MWKKILIVFGVLFIIPLIQGQVGPTVFTPRLTVSPGPLTVTTGLTTVQNLLINGTCTGCASAPGGLDTQVQYNDGGVFNGSTGLTFDDGSQTLVVENATFVTQVNTNGNFIANVGVQFSLTGRNLGTGTVDNYFDAVAALRTSNAGAVSLTGMTVGTNTGGRLRYIVHASANNLTIINEGLTSDPENRFVLPGAVDLVLGQNDNATFIYDPVNSRWRLIATVNY